MEFDTIRTTKLANQEELAYRIVGSGPINFVLLHGNLISGYFWKPLLPFLDPKRYKIWIVDMRGFGHSSYRSKISKLNDLAEDIYEFCQVIKIVK